MKQACHSFIICTSHCLRSSTYGAVSWRSDSPSDDNLKRAFVCIVQLETQKIAFERSVTKPWIPR